MPGSWARALHSAESPTSVAGVLRPEFVVSSEAMPAEGPMEKADVFVPLPFGPDAAQRRGTKTTTSWCASSRAFRCQQAQADIDIIASRIREKDKRDRTFGMTVVTLQDQVVGDIRRALLVLFGSWRWCC